jgi:hypothetical protein
VAISFRDRLLTPQGVRALLSPVGILVAVAFVVVAWLSDFPLWLAVPIAVALWAANVWRLVRPRDRSERIDPFTLHDPWRRFVQEALQARARFGEAVSRAPDGPLRDRLAEIAERMDTGVRECWLIAKRGQALVEARRGIDVAGLDRKLAAGRAADGGTPSPARATELQALEAQRASASRLDEVIERTRTELQVLDARLDEAVAKTLELSAQASADAGTAAGLDGDVDALVTEMEALRQALEETTAASAPPPAELPGSEAS